MMTNCEIYIEKISALVDAELSDGEEAAVLAHIAGCPFCAAMHKAFTEISKCLPQITVEPPENLKDSIMLKIRDEAKAPKRPKLSFFRYAGLAAVFALVIFAAVSGGKAPVPVQTACPEDASGYSAGIGGNPDATPDKAPETPENGLRATSKDYPHQSISDMRYFSNYLESIPSEEYENAADEYEGELYGILVLEGDVPAVLQETDMLHENNREVYLEVSKDEIESLSKNSDDVWLIMNDASAEKGIVIIKKDEINSIPAPEE